MKKLFLIRHAKSSWADPGQRDMDRPLNDRGERNLVLMSHRLADRISGPVLLVSSPAVRALTTAKGFAHAMGIPSTEIVLNERIYEAPLAWLIDVVHGLDERYDQVLLFGHNPGFSQLLNYLTDEWQDMPTCAIAEIELFVTRWNHVGQEAGRLVSFDYPKKHHSADSD